MLRAPALSADVVYAPCAVKYWSLLFVGFLVAGCEARFDSLSASPPVVTPDAGMSDSGLPDAGLSDAGMEDGGIEFALFSQGTWEGRSGYRASGSASLWTASDDRGFVQFEDDFESTSVPGPFVVVSTRDSLSGGVQESLGDQLLGPLQSVSGSQTYQIATGASSLRYVWVYCQPFTVEVARAALTEVP